MKNAKDLFWLLNTDITLFLYTHEKNKTILTARRVKEAPIIVIFM